VPGGGSVGRAAADQGLTALLLWAQEHFRGASVGPFLRARNVGGDATDPSRRITSWEGLLRRPIHYVAELLGVLERGPSRHAR
jgi:hypothetical protein